MMSSFINLKCMMCYYCCRNVPIDEESFPEDLYDLIRQYNMSQLFWICKYCYEGTDLTTSISELSIGQKKLDRKLTDLTECVRSLSNQMKRSWSSSQSNLSNASLDDIGDRSDNASDFGNVLFNCDKKGVKNRSPTTFSTPKNNHVTEDKFNSSIACVDMAHDDSGFETSSVKSMKSLSSTSTKQSKDPPLSVKVLSPVSTKQSKDSPLTYIHAILNNIKISKTEDAQCRKIINLVLEKLLESLKRDPDFSCLYQKLYYTGSAYSELRIHSATEFDIDLILKMPYPVTLLPEFFDKTYAFGKIKVEEPGNLPRPVEKFIKSCASDGYLIPQNVLSWLQRHIDNVLRENFDYPDGVLNIRSVQSGPAKTLLITTLAGHAISIDLVPVFEFDSSALKGTPFLESLQKISKDTTKQTWLMVPKGCVGEIDLTLSDAKQSWRFDFPEAEKVVLHNKDCAKPVIKILKSLRDKQNWKDLASYYIKTVVLLKVLENSSKQYWSNAVLFERFLEMLKKLKGHLDDQNLPHFISGNNLFHKMNKIQCSNWSNYLQKVISAVETKPNSFANFFL